MAFKDYMQCGAEETVQWIKYVPQRHEDLVQIIPISP